MYIVSDAGFKTLSRGEFGPGQLAGRSTARDECCLKMVMRIMPLKWLELHMLACCCRNFGSLQIVHQASASLQVKI